MDPFAVRYEHTPFLQTSKTGAYANRLNWRCEIILTRNQQAVKQKRILDLASHDGRFSYACLKLGARHVTGIEARPGLVEKAHGNLLALGCRKDSFRFVTDDVFDYLPEIRPGDFDTVLCLGFISHTVRQVQLFDELKRIAAPCFILDNCVDLKFRQIAEVLRKLQKSRLYRMSQFLRKGSGGHPLRYLLESLEDVPYLAFRDEENESEGNTTDSLRFAARPSQALLEKFFNKYGFRFRLLEWPHREIQDWEYLKDYREGARLCYLAQRCPSFI
jgi:SAM-dependent methyltransferase